MDGIRHSGFRQDSWSFGANLGLFSLKNQWISAHFPSLDSVNDGEIWGTIFIRHYRKHHMAQDILRGRHGWPRRVKILNIRYSRTWNTSYSVKRNLENKIPYEFPWVIDNLKNNSLSFPDFFLKAYIFQVFQGMSESWSLLQ